MEEKLRELQEIFTNPYVAAQKGVVDVAIDPRKTRYCLVKALQMMGRKKERRSAKKHGSIPS